MYKKWFAWLFVNTKGISIVADPDTSKLKGLSLKNSNLNWDNYFTGQILLKNFKNDSNKMCYF